MSFYSRTFNCKQISYPSSAHHKSFEFTHFQISVHLIFKFGSSIIDFERVFCYCKWLETAKSTFFEMLAAKDYFYCNRFIFRFQGKLILHYFQFLCLHCCEFFDNFNRMMHITSKIRSSYAYNECDISCAHAAQ